jgi:hypothetical protein
VVTRTEIARLLVPTVQNRNRFFQAELLLMAEGAGLSIHELPLDSSSVYRRRGGPGVGGRFITR